VVENLGFCWQLILGSNPVLCGYIFFDVSVDKGIHIFSKDLSVGYSYINAPRMSMYKDQMGMYLIYLI
jgi:hypothetical protein